MKRKICYICIFILVLCSCNKTNSNNNQNSNVLYEAVTPKPELQVSEDTITEVPITAAPVVSDVPEILQSDNQDKNTQNASNGMVEFNGSKIYPDEWEYDYASYTSCTLDEANDDCGYQLETKYYEYTDKDNNEVSVPYIQISGLNDKDKQAKINECLKLRQTEWITEDVFWIRDDMDFEIMLMTEDYLSFKCYLKGVKNDSSPVYGEPQYCIVIDMNKGKDMKLEDVVDLDDFFKKMEAINCYQTNESGWDDSVKEYRRNRLNDMNITMLEKYNSVSPDERDSYYFFEKADWCMVKEGMYLYHSQLRESPNEVIFFDDLKDILKVAEW